MLDEHNVSINYFNVQISEVEVVGKQEQMTAKDALLLWAQKVTQGYVINTQILLTGQQHFLSFRKWNISIQDNNNFEIEIIH